MTQSVVKVNLGDPPSHQMRCQKIGLRYILVAMTMALVMNLQAVIASMSYQVMCVDRSHRLHLLASMRGTLDVLIPFQQKVHPGGAHTGVEYELGKIPSPVLLPLCTPTRWRKWRRWTTIWLQGHCRLRSRLNAALMVSARTQHITRLFLTRHDIPSGLFLKSTVSVSQAALGRKCLYIGLEGLPEEQWSRVCHLPSLQAFCDSTLGV